MKSKRGRTGYSHHTAENIRKRSIQSGSNRDPMFKDVVKTFTPDKGQNRVRFLPPTWDHADHFGVDIFLHYNIGSEGAGYLCLNKNEHLVPEEDQGQCPVCKLIAKLKPDENEEWQKAAQPKKRVMAYVVNRDKERDGVMLWSMPYTVDKELAEISQDDDGSIRFVDDEKHGYDLRFNREGAGQQTKYTSLRLSSKPLKLSDDEYQAAEWMEFAEKNPLPEMVITYPPEHIEHALSGGIKTGKSDKKKRDDDFDDEEDERPVTRRRSRPVLDDEEDEEAAIRGKSRSRRDEEDEDEDEDERPARKISKRRATDDEEDEDEEPRARRSTAKRSKRAAEVDEDDEDEEDDEEERPAARKSAKGKARASRDDDDDDEEVDEEEDESQPPPKRDRTAARGRAKLTLGKSRR